MVAHGITLPAETAGSRKERVFDDNFSYFLSKPCCRDGSDEGSLVQMRGHNMCLYAELTKKKKSRIITKYSLLSRALGCPSYVH